MEIHGKDLQVVEGALRVAAEVYKKDAESFRAGGNPRFASGFLSQAADCSRLLMRIADEGEDD